MSGCIAGDEAPLSMRVVWGLTEPSATIPRDVFQIRLQVWTEGAAMPEESIRTVENLPDADMNDRPEFDRDRLPVGEPIRLTVIGETMARAPIYIGTIGPIVLQHGERRHVDLRMYSISEATVIDGGALTTRAMPTATTLPDGRVLLAGGFDRITTTTCPASVDASATCFAMTASSTAALFDIATGRVIATRRPMLVARGGHTATVLDDGRVLFAGGTEDAILAFVPQAGGAVPVFLPGDGGDTFELFDPEASPEAEDIDRDGDPGRGAFIGAADDAAEPGRLDVSRALHGAARLADGRVLLAGGAGSPGSFTVFDPQRAGGYGVVGSGALSTDHALPGVAATGTGATSRGWIIGGSAAADNDGLLDVWAPGTATAPLGTAETATADLDFPDAAMTARPELALLSPLTTTVGMGRYVLAIGWLGPRCTGTTPAFDAAAPLCAYAASSLRSFTIDSTTGTATPTMVRNAHSLGALAVLSDGRVAVTGGVTGLGMQAGNTIDVFSGTVIGGMAGLDAAMPFLSRPRALHASAALPDGALVTFGGIAPSADLSSITAVPGIEVVFIR